MTFDSESFKVQYLNIDLSEYRATHVAGIPILIPEYFSLTQEKYLIASQMTLYLQNKSVDYFLKRYCQDYEEKRENSQDEKDRILTEALSFIKAQNAIIFNKLSGIDFKDQDNTGVFASTVAFHRLQTTYKSIHYHLKFGYYFESMMSLRLLLEQLAYSYCAVKSGKENPKEFLSPTKAITGLKKLIPDVGKLYGILSKLSHIDTVTVGKYINDENGKVAVIQHSLELVMEALLYYLRIIEIQHVVFEYCFKDFLKVFNFIEVNNDLQVSIPLEFKKSIAELFAKIYKVASFEKM
jgi:hypothetical protein